MRKIFSLYVAIGLASLLMLLVPQNVFGAQLTFKEIPNSTLGDKTTVIEVRIDPQSKKLNVVEGTIDFQGTVSDKLSVGIETGGSALKLWPTAPKYIPSEKAIRFIGGVPGGFNNESLLFRMRLTSLSSGNVTIAWIDGTAYLNDGKGTKEAISAEPVTLTVNPQNADAVSEFSLDVTPPTFEAVEVGQDPTVYGGKYFVSFQAADDISGVERYEVKEGQTITNVIDGVYVPRDQSFKTPITVTAYDQAGNSTTVEVPARFNWAKGVTIILLIVIVLFLAFLYGYKKIIKK